MKATITVLLAGVFAVLLGVVWYFSMKGQPDQVINPPSPELVSAVASSGTEELGAAVGQKTPESSANLEDVNKPGTGESPVQATPKAIDPALASVKSPQARRYLRFLLPDGRLSDESHGGSIVNGAFGQAWGLSARLELSDRQQDALAEFLLEKDWRRWEEVKPEELGDWAEANGLTGPERATLAAFVQQCKEGAMMVYKLTQQIKTVEYGGRSPAEVFAIESALLTDIIDPDGGDLTAEALELLKMDDLSKAQYNKMVKLESAIRPHKLLAERIPMTDEQSLATLTALRRGAKPPINAYAYQSGSYEQVESRVRKDSAWLGDVLGEDQYETYVEHFLGEIEMVRFQQRRR